MTETKIYTQRIDYKDVNDMYKRKEKSCMKILRSNFEGRCYKGAYIVNILSIEKISDIEISRDHTDARGYSSVTFKAQVTQRIDNDLIANCRIFKRKGNKTFAKIDNGDVIILNHDLLKILNEGDMIPVTVVKSRCTVLNDKISVFATPYVPNIPIKNYIYIMEGTINDIEFKKLNTYVNQIADLKDWFKKLNSSDSKKFVAFDNIFYPFKKSKKPKLLENKKISVLDISHINFKTFKNSIIIQSSEIIRSKSFVLTANIVDLSSIEKMIEKNSILKYKVIKEKSYLIFELLFNYHIKYLLFIKDMIQEYDYPKENNIYWKSLKEYKQ